MVDLKEKAASLPLKPGVYIMMDKNKKVIYVGKAKALKNRVSSYFQHNTGHTPKTKRLVARIADFDTIITPSEAEALYLECSLIRRHQPRYNILLKNSKGYPFISLNVRAEYPNFSVTFRPEEDEIGARYFGPYGGYGMSLSVIHTLRQTLRMPVCDKSFPRDIGKGRPCLEAHLHRCCAVCTGNVSKEDYAETVRQAVLLLEGKAGKLLSELEAQMLEASDNLHFEKAAQLRDKQNAVAALTKRQIVVGGGMADMDVIGCVTGEVKGGVTVLHYIGGTLISRDVEIIDEPSDPNEVLTAFLTQYYPARRRCPKRVLLSHPIEDAENVAQFIFDKTGSKPELTVPRRGEKRALTELALVNAAEEAERVTTREEKVRKLLIEMQKLMGLDVPPRRIEAVDISNTGKSERVGVITCFTDGKPLKRAYRQFIIQNPDIQDDYHSMEEVLTRRLKRAAGKSEGFQELPDLLLVDGGMAHASMARRVLEETGFSIPVFGMVKDDKHRTRALVHPDGSEIGLSGFPAGFAFIGQIQEETHNAAITFHQKRRSRFSSELDKISGVGETRRRLLLDKFKSVKAVKQAPLEALREILPDNAAKSVYRYFHESPDAQASVQTEDKP